MKRRYSSFNSVSNPPCGLAVNFRQRPGGSRARIRALSNKLKVSILAIVFRMQVKFHSAGSSCKFRKEAIGLYRCIPLFKKT